MDQDALVNAGHIIVKELDKEGSRPRAAMWVADEQRGWKLWIVPDSGTKDQRDFYRRAANAISKHRSELGSIDASDLEMVAASHPAVKGLSRIIQMDELGSAHFSSNMLNGYYLPNAIVLRMAA